MQTNSVTETGYTGYGYRRLHWLRLQIL